MRIEPPTRTPRWACSNLNIDSPGKSLWPCHDGVRPARPAQAARIDTFHHDNAKAAELPHTRVRLEDHDATTRKESPVPQQADAVIGLPPATHEPMVVTAQTTAAEVVDPSLIPAGILTTPVNNPEPRTTALPTRPPRWRVFHTVGILILLLVLEILIIRYLLG